MAKVICTGKGAPAALRPLRLPHVQAVRAVLAGHFASEPIHIESADDKIRVMVQISKGCAR
jgi:hypothetical protein